MPTDMGMDIAADQLQKIFQTFEQSEGQKFSAFGLWLIKCRFTNDEHGKPVGDHALRPEK